MNPGKQLHDLQEIDLDLGKKREILLQVEKQLQQNEALAQAREDLQTKRQQLADTEKTQKEREWATDDLLAKAQPLRVKLYGGSVKNPKELTSLKQQVEQLNSQIRCEEDTTLEIMGQIEAARTEVAVQAGKVETMEAEWQKRRTELTAERAFMISAMDAASKKREVIVAAIDASCLYLYETVRARKQGYAVARVEQGRCHGCRITLSTSEITRARVGELVECNSCGRILYLG